MKSEVNRRWQPGRGCWAYTDEDGEYHRDNDQPAIVCQDKSREWFRHGLWHREDDKPAIIIMDIAKQIQSEFTNEPPTPFMYACYWYDNGVLTKKVEPCDVHGNVGD